MITIVLTNQKGGCWKSTGTVHLAAGLAPLDNLIDVVLIDTPPTPSLLSTVVFMAADYALFPTKCESLHFDGLRRALDHRERANESRQDRGLGNVEMLGVIPVMFRAKTGEHQDHYQLLLNRYGDKVWKPIADSIIWAEAARVQRPVFAYAPNTKTAKEAWRMVSEFEARLPA